MQRRFLEDIIEEEKEILLKRENSLIFKKGIITGPIDFITDHPILISSLGFLTSEILEKENIFPKQNLLQDISLSYLTYLSIKGLGKLLGKYKIEKNILKNPSLSSLLLMGSLFAYSFLPNPYPKELIIEYHKSLIPILGMSTEILIYGYNSSKKIKNSYKNKSLKESIWNFVFEHPILIGSSYALYETLSMYIERIKNKSFSGNIMEDFSSEPLWPVLSLGLFGAYNSLALFPSLLGGIFHTDSLNLIKNKVIKSYYKYKARFENDENKRFLNYEKSIKLQKNLIKRKDSRESEIERLVELSNLYKIINKEQEAYSYYRMALRKFSKLDNNLSYFEYMKKTFRLDKLLRFVRKNKSENIESIFIDLLNNDLTALDKLKVLAESNDIKQVYMYGKGLEILGFLESGKKQILNVAERLIKEKNIELKSGNKREIFLFKDNFFGSELVVISDNIEDKINSEINKTNEIRKILDDTKKLIDDFDNCEVVKPIGYKNINNKFWYVTERGYGCTLEESIKKNEAKLEDFLQIANFMGLIHSKVSVSGLKERNFLIIKDKLNKCNIEEKEITNIYKGIEVLTENFSKIKKVYNKDGNFRNWIKLEYGGILMIDIEVKDITPVAYDLGRLLTYHKFLNYEERNKVLEKHRESYIMHGHEKISLEEYKLAYLSSVIIMGFELYTFNDNNIKINALENAYDAIKRIKLDFMDNYEKNKKVYENLIVSIEKFCSSLK